MTSNRLKGNLIVLFAIIIVFLIVPTSFAHENNTDKIDISANEIDLQVIEQNTLKEKYDTIYVNASSGTSNGTGTSDNPVKTISEGLNLINDGGTIYLNGEFIGDGNSNIVFDGNLKSVNFIGTGDTKINGNHTTSFATINSGTYSFSNVAFINHFKTGPNEEFGGAITNTNGKLTFTNCLFENNTVLGVNKGNGGAIDNSGTLTIINCTFKNNIANVTNSSGYRKNAADGGALSNVGNLNIYNTTFVENKALRNGGAIRTQDNTHTYIENCKFTKNIAAYHLSGGSYGGAIYTWNSGLELYNSVFENNIVYDASGYGARGGALSLNRGIGNTKITSCQFINNTAGGVSTVDGQSIFFDSIEATVNYCTIDTSIYSYSQTVDLNYNWWIAKDGDIESLIENLPPSASIKRYAELNIFSDAETIEIGEEITVFVNLCWNGTKNQNNIGLIPLKTIYLESLGGVLDETEFQLNKGSFITFFYPTDETVMITAYVDNIAIKSSSLIESNESEIYITTKDIYEGENAIIGITLKNNQTCLCLIDIGNIKYYAEIIDGKGELLISGLKAGSYDMNIALLGEDIYKTNKTLIVKNKLDSGMKISVEKTNKTAIITVKLDKNATGNIYANVNGDKIINKTVENGACEIPLENLENGIYSIEISYSGDSRFASKSLFTNIIMGDGRKDTQIEVAKSVTRVAVDSNAKEQGDYLYAILKDSFGNPLKNKEVQIAFNGKLYNVKTNDQGKTGLKISLAAANTYTYAISFKGDGEYNAATMTCTKLTVTKKSTSIKATSKVFKAKSKRKAISVTLKTSKNPYDKKTYLSSGKKLTLTVNKKKYTAKINKKGVAKFNIKLTKKGKYNALIKFGGDKTYKATSKRIKITIK